jgi:hypothetical protein
LEKLDKRYRKNKVMETYGKVRQYLKVERGKEEKIEDYLHSRVSQKKPGCNTNPGVGMRMGLEGRAMEVGMTMERSELKKKDGAEKLLEKLDKRYRKDKVMETYGKVRQYLKVERGKEEKIEDYLHRYDKLAEECKKATGNNGMLDGEIKGCHLLEQANVDESQKQMIIAACGKDKLEYNMVQKVMRRIFEGLGGKEEKKEEDWWEDRGRRERGNVRETERKYMGNRGNGRRNPMDKGGRITKCAICGSESHWARECPQNYNNKKKGINKGENNGDKKEEEKVFIGGVEENDNYWEEIEAILDTGCNSTLCGEL